MINASKHLALRTLDFSKAMRVNTNQPTTSAIAGGGGGAIDFIISLAIELKECQFLLIYGDHFEQGWHDVKSNV